MTPPKASDAAIEAVEAYNANPARPFDQSGDQKVYYRARLPILATDCDYEIVSISGVQGCHVARAIAAQGGGE